MNSYYRLDNSYDGIEKLNVPTNISDHPTSCSCQNCIYKPKNQTPNNHFYYTQNTDIAYGPESNDPLSCQLTDFSCNDNIIFNAYQQPALKEHPRDIKVYNQDFGLTYSPNFYKYPSGCDKKEGWFSPFDSRLIDAARGMKTVLDRPSYEGSVPLSNIYDKQFENYGKNYKNYRSINAGQIVYYKDSSIADPYFQPLYTIRSGTVARVFKDPMSSTKVYFDRIEDQKTLNNLHPLQDMRDSLSFREDIMSKQMSLMNRNRFVSRWSSPNYE